jgi:aminopeptidase N
VPYTRQNNLLSLRLPQTPSPGDLLEVAIAYQGQPQPGFLVGFKFWDHQGVPVVYTNCEPIAARTWWPCKDRPDDKFTADLRFIVPDTLIAASNGLLAGVQDLPGRRRLYHWVERYPITTYLVSLVATDFATFYDTYTAQDGRQMPLTYYAYSEDLPRAMQDWAFTPQAIGALAGLFGEYPFLEEKYGMAQFPWGGAEEHQTLTSMGTYFLRLPEPADWVVVHELAHQWWGNWVTCGTWRDIWLNEGFATYCEALWAEHLGGPDSLRADMLAKKSDHFHGPCYDPEFLFNSTVYRKGAWVMHMLRHVVGDATFFDALRQYAQAHAYGNAVTEDLKRSYEAAWGHDLDWFFAEWVYGEGQPRYRVLWEPVTQELDGRTRVRIEVRQETTGPQYFKMPLDARFHLVDGGEFVTVLWDSLPEQAFLVDTPAPPDSLAIDPRDWVLGTVLFVAEPGWVDGDEEQGGGRWRLALGAPTPNPSARVLQVPLRLDPGIGDPTRLAFTLSIHDAAGRLVRSLSLQDRPGAVRGFEWDGSDAMGHRQPPGIYFGRLNLQGVACGRSVRILRVR